MELKFDHNLCTKFSRIKKAGFDDAAALEKMDIKTHWSIARKLCNWHSAKFKREQEIKKREDLADDYFELKANGMPADKALNYLNLHGKERKEFVHFIVMRKYRPLNSRNENIAYDKNKIINKIIELKATKNTPLWIIKHFNVSPYTAGLIHRKLNNG